MCSLVTFPSMSSHSLFSLWKRLHPGIKRQISAEMNVGTKTHLANERQVSLHFMDVNLYTHLSYRYLILWWYRGNSAVCHLDILWELLQGSGMISISPRTQFIRREVLIVLRKCWAHSNTQTFAWRNASTPSQVYGSTYKSSFSPWNSQWEGLI